MPAKRKPASHHALQGTARPDRERRRVIVPGTLPKVPSWITADAKREYKRVLKLLAEAGQEHISQLDAAALTAYAVNWAAWVESEKILQRDGSTVSKNSVNRSTGNVTGTTEVVSPWVRISKERLQSLLKAATALGFDPRSRSSLALPEPKEKGDSIEDYLEGEDDDAPITARPRSVPAY
jgi:P27 family predicted phage terminase small subunit